MKLKGTFLTHDTDGEQIMVAVGDEEFHGLVRSNATAAFIVDCLKEETTKEEILRKMQDRYDGPKELMEADIERIIGQLSQIGAIV